MQYVFVASGIVVGMAWIPNDLPGPTPVPSGPAGSTEYAIADNVVVAAGYTCSVTNGTPSFAAPTLNYGTLTPIEYYNAFAVQEAIDIKGSSDPVVQEIWYRLQMAIANSGNSPIINPNSTPVQSGLTYLSTNNVVPVTIPARTYITTARIAQICSGVAQ